MLSWLRRRYRDACGTKTPPALGVAVGASLWEVSSATSLVCVYCTVISCRVEHHANSGSHALSLRLNADRVSFLQGAEKGVREIMSFSSLEGNLGTVLSCGCNYEYYSDYSVLWKGITGRYIVLELLAALLSYLFCLFGFF